MTVDRPDDRPDPKPGSGPGGLPGSGQGGLPGLEPDGVPGLQTPQGLQSGAVRGAIWTVIHTFISLPVAFVVNLLVARTLGAPDYGRLAFLTALMEVVSALMAGGFTAAVIQFGAKAHAAGRRGDVARLLSQAQGFRLLVVMPVLSLLVLLVADVSPQAMAVAVVFGVVLPAALDGTVACLTIENKTAQAAQIVLVISLVMQVVVTVVALSTRNPDAIWTSRLVVSGIGLLLCMIPISHAYRRAVLSPRLFRSMPPGFWRFALPVGLAGVVGGLVISRSEVFVLNWLSTPTALGVFALAFGLASHVFAPAQAFVGPLVPAISGLREVEASAVPDAFRRVIRAGSTVAGLIVAVAVVPLAVLVPVLYGGEFASAAPLFIALSLAGALVLTATPVVAFVSARLSGGALLRAYVVALAVDVALAVALVPRIGVWGAVIANVAGTLLSLALLGRTEIRLLGLPLRLLMRDSAPLWWGQAIALPAAVAALGLGGNAWLRAAAAGLAGLLVYLGGLRLLHVGLTPRDGDAITRVLPRAVAPWGGRVVGLLSHSVAGLGDRGGRG